MFELFRRSSQEDRVILDTQIRMLSELADVAPDKRDDIWIAHRDFAISVARDTLKRVVPADTALAMQLMKFDVTVADPNSSTHEIDAGELAFFNIALKNINWSNVGSTGSPLPIDSSYQQISAALPELIYRHPWFKFLLTAIIALLVLIGTGTFKFYDLTVDVQKKIDEKSNALQAQLDAQTRTLNASMKAQFDQSNALNGQLDGLVKQASAASVNLKTLQDEAARAISYAASSAARQINADVQNGQATFDDKLDEARRKAIDAVAAAGVERAKQVTNANGEQGFIDKLRDFETKTAKALNDLEALQQREKTLTEGIAELKVRQDHYAQIALVANPNEPLTERLAVYFDTAVHWVWWAVFILTVSCLIHIIVFIRWRARRQALLGR